MTSFKSILIASFFCFAVHIAFASIYCPPPITLQCYDDVNYLQKTGRATAIGYPTSMIKYKDQSFLNGCRSGYISRKWYLDLNSNNQINNDEPTCVQIITLTADNSNISIQFPDNKTYSCIEDIVFEKPTWTAGPCDKLAYSYEDQVFNVAEDACYKILRKFTVINWCNNQPNSSQNTVWNHIQQIKVVEKTPPKILQCNHKIIELDADCKANFEIENNAIDEGICPTGLLSWIVKIDLWGDGSTDYTYGYTESGLFEIKAVASNTPIKITLPVKVAMGKHKVKWSVKDACGNYSSCETSVETKDLKPPTSYMHPLLTAAFQANFMDLMVQPQLFNISSSDNCTPSKYLRFSFSPNVFDTTRIVKCDNAGFQIYNIYVTDLQGNQSSTEVILLAFDNGSCLPGNKISGSIQEANGQAIQAATLKMKSQSHADEMIAYSDTEGRFEWSNVHLYENTELIPQYDQKDSKRTDIVDLKMLQDYIMGNRNLVNFEWLAADLDNDYKIRIKDLDMLKKMILDPKMEQPYVWRFFIDVDSITDVSQLKNIKPSLMLATSDGSLDFKGVYLGDLSDANDAISLPRNVLNLIAKKTNTGTDYYVNAYEKVEGLQLSLVFEDHRRAPILTSSYFDAQKVSTYYDEKTGVLNVLGLFDLQLDPKIPLFTISNKNDGSENIIQVLESSKILLTGYRSKTLLEQKNVVADADIILAPNPNHGTFSLYADGEVNVVAITNTQGQNIPFYANGSDVSLIAAPGIYFITLRSGSQLTIKKMLIQY